MWVEHFIPTSHNNEKRNRYENCFYSCQFCNSARGDTLNIDHQDRRLLNPCQDAWGEVFQIAEDEIQPKGEDRDALYTRDTYDLNDPRKVEIRRFRRETLSERINVVEKGRALHDRFLQRAQQTGDASFVDDAKEVWEVFQLALKDLGRFNPIPPNADEACRCGQNLSLPLVLEEQLL